MRVLVICPELPSADKPGSMAPAARQFDSLRALGLELDVVDMRGLPILKYLFAIPKVRRLASRADVMHAHFGFCAWLAYLATRLRFRKTPFVISYMGDDLLGTPFNVAGDLTWFSRVMIRANRWLASRADRVIVKSEEMLQVVAPIPATVVPNGVDIDSFQPIEQSIARHMLEWTDQGLKVLFPGNPENPRKGHVLASDAVASAGKLLGGPLELVPLWGVRPEQVPLIMNACDAMVMTSLIEGSPNVVKEALACNLPVIGVAVGDVPAMLAGIEGCACCPRDADAIGQALVAALTPRPVTGRGTGRAAPRSTGRAAIVARGLDLESVAKRVQAIYRSLAEVQSIPQPIHPTVLPLSSPTKSES